jgi:hypothetical protein
MRGACGVLRRTRLVEPKGSLQNLPLRHIKKAPFGFVGQRGLLSASVGIDSSLRSSPLRGACGVLRRTRLVEPKGSLQNLPLRHIKKAPFGACLMWRRGRDSNPR